MEERCDKKEERGRPGGRSLLWAGAPHLAKEKCFFLSGKCKRESFSWTLVQKKMFYLGLDICFVLPHDMRCGGKLFPQCLS